MLKQNERFLLLVRWDEKETITIILYALIMFLQYYFYIYPIFSVEDPEILKMLNILYSTVLIFGVILLAYVAKYGLNLLWTGFFFASWKKKLNPEEYKKLRIALGQLILIELLLFGIAVIFLKEFGLPDYGSKGHTYPIGPEFYIFPIGIIIAGIIQYIWTKKKFG